VSVKQKESNQYLDHKLKPKKTKARISYSPDQKREFVAVFTLPETVEETQSVCSACGGGLLQNTLPTKSVSAQEKRTKRSRPDRCDCLGEEDEAVPLNVPCHVL
jgi:HSP20 family molecular chaperone IbpA